jgi:DNA-binding GntR family transcriptional regulator
MSAEPTMATKEPLNLAVYAGIKASLLRGDYTPGERLDGRTLEVAFNVSSTPVRNALYRLFGEGLIEQNNTDGLFHAPLLSERGICHLYQVEDEVLASCLRASRRNRDGVNDGQVTLDLAQSDSIAITERLFCAIAQASMNNEFLRIVSHLNDRLRWIRLSEGAAVPNRLAEILNIQSAWAAVDRGAASARLKEYHKIRLNSVRKIIIAAERRQRSQ